jgi:hypothetical protein
MDDKSFPSYSFTSAYGRSCAPTDEAAPFEPHPNARNTLAMINRIGIVFFNGKPPFIV